MRRFSHGLRTIDPKVGQSIVFYKVNVRVVSQHPSAAGFLVPYYTAAVVAVVPSHGNN